MKSKELQLWVLIRNTTFSLARGQGFKILDVRPLKKRDEGVYVGSCSKRGLIRIGLRNRFGKLFEPYHYIDTIAHEVAHLPHQNHSADWFRLHVKLLTELEQNGVYLELRKLLKNK